MSRLRLRLAVAIVTLAALFGAADGLAASVVISEVYGGGGNAGATYTHDYIELYNPTSSSVSLAGWSVQYAAAGGTGAWLVTNLTGSIGAGRYYLVRQAAGAGGSVPLPGPDATGTTAMSATAGKVALVSSTTALSGACPANLAIVDLVGYGAANCSETAPTPTLSNTTAALRKSGGSQDTQNNSADFEVGSPQPEATADSAPFVASTTPVVGSLGVPVDFDITVRFSEPVDVTGAWYTINCTTSGAHAATASGGPTTFSLDPAADFVKNESCTVTVIAANVTDQDTDDPPNAMAANRAITFQTAEAVVCGDTATPIHAVQGPGNVSPFDNAIVTIEGVVVGDYQAPGQFNGFYIQEDAAHWDADVLTSEGVFVSGGFTNVSVGDVVRVRGTADEVFSQTEINLVRAAEICSTGAATPAAPATLPVASVGDLERFEGMKVALGQELTVTEVFNLGRFGEASLSGAGRLYTPTAVAEPGAAAQAVADLNNRSRIILDDANNEQNIDPTRYPLGGLSALNTLRVGDSLPALEGVLGFGFGNYRIQPVGPLDFIETNPRTPAPAAVGGNLKIASFNVLNYFNGNGLGGGFPTSRGAESQFEFDRQEAKIVSALAAIDGDIVGLMEIENDATPNSAIEELVAALNAATAPGTYAYIDTGVIGTDEIKVALIYKPAAVTPVGDWGIITTAVDPRFIDTLNRPSLAQTFAQNSSGQALTVVVNHLKSKGSACAGDPDNGDGSGNCNLTRTNAAAALADWLATDPTGSGDPDVLIIGDLNSYTFETPITTLEADGYTNLVRAYHGLAAYSYVFNGESGYLDHALATSSLSAQVTGVSDWHINPDEPTVLDYNTNFKSANHVNTLYDPGPYRASDHDPVIIGVQLNHAPTADAGGPYSVPEGSSVTVTASGSDADGDTLSYAWDLDNDGAFDDATVQSPSFSAASIDGLATQTIRVQVTDGEASTVDEATVTVTNVAPTATFNAPASGFAGFSFTLSLTNASDAAPADVPGLTYAFDCGGGYGAFSSSSTATCPTNSIGTRSVGGKVRDDDAGETEYRGSVVIQVTYASLCALVRSYVDDADVADSLCSKLAAAEAAAARGNDKAKRASLAAFVKQVEAQSGKSMTAAEAATLAELAKDL